MANSSPSIRTAGFRRRGRDASLANRFDFEGFLLRRKFLPVHTPWKILIPHSTTTMANTSVATANTLSKEATLILLSASSPVSGLVDSLIHLQSRGHNRLNDTVVLWFAGHTFFPILGTVAMYPSPEGDAAGAPPAPRRPPCPLLDFAAIERPKPKPTGPRRE